MQLVRLAPVLAARGARVIVETQASIERIVRTCPGIAAVVPRGAPLPPHDLETPIGSVPFRLGLTLDSIPGTVPYLAADPALVADAERRIGRDGPFTVGIAWQGNPVFPQDCHRSMPLRHFAPLAAIPGVRLFSLQKGFGAEQLAAAPFPVEDLGAALDAAGGAFTDTAAAMMALDLVIVSDSAVAHVAGALGRPVWVVLPLAPDWRWLLDREDTPWYPTMRLFRQRRLGEWDEVFERIAAALGAAVKPSAGGSPRVGPPLGLLPAPPLELRGRQRPADVQPLGVVAPEPAERLEDVAVLDALRGHGEPHVVREVDRRAHDRRVVGIAHEPDDERLVDLQLVHRQPLQVGERGIAGPEVVDRQADAHPVQALEDRQRVRGVLHDGALGDLEREQLRPQLVRARQLRERRAGSPGCADRARRC